MTWDDEGWCVMGTDPDGDGTGEPVTSWQCPPVSASARQFEGPDALERSDSFTATELSPIWQWPANPAVGQYFLNPSEGSLRLICRPLPEGSRSLWDSPALLLRKLIDPEDSFTARLNFHPSYGGDRAGITVMGESYAALSLLYEDGSVYLTHGICEGADTGASETETARLHILLQHRRQALPSHRRNIHRPGRTLGRSQDRLLRHRTHSEERRRNS